MLVDATEVPVSQAFYPPSPAAAAAIQARGLTISETARLAGRNAEYVSRALRGVHPMTEALARDLGRVLGVDPALLMPERPDRAKAS